MRETNPNKRNLHRSNNLRSIQQLFHASSIALGGKLFKNKTLTGPWRVLVSVTDHCNYSCIMCREHSPYAPEEYQNQGKDLPSSEKKFYELASMDFDLYCSLIDDLHKLGTRLITISGKGEPFTHKDIFPMIEYAKKKNFRVAVTSNGSMLNNDRCLQLIDIGLDELYLSINAGTETTYNKITGAKQSNYFGQIKENIKILARKRNEKGLAGPRLLMDFVLSAQNLSEVESMVKYAVYTEVDSINFVPVSIYYKNTSFLDLSDENIQDLVDHIIPLSALADQNSITHNIHEIKRWINSKNPNTSNYIYHKIPCYVGWYLSLILANGTVMPCCQCQKCMGNICEQSFCHIWNSAIYREFRRDSRNLPTYNSTLSGCLCTECSHVPANIRFHKLLSPFKSRIV